MTRTRLMMIASAGFCLGSVLLFGCTNAGYETSDEGLFPPKAQSAAGPGLEELKYEGVGTIVGMVEYDGTPPTPSQLPGLDAHADRSYCLKGNIDDPTWIVDPATKGVENVVVWVQPPKGKYFKKPDDALKNWEDNVTVDQPYCQFIPHVVVLYPQYFDGTSYTSTGQKLTVLNSAEIGHNIKVGGSPDKNPSKGATLVAKTGQYIYEDIRLDPRPLAMNCDIHKWMTGYALTFDHPYAARTEKGKFIIKNVPAGVPLTFMGWHEDLKKFSPEIPGGTTITLKPGETLPLNFKVKKK